MRKLISLLLAALMLMALAATASAGSDLSQGLPYAVKAKLLDGGDAQQHGFVLFAGKASAKLLHGIPAMSLNSDIALATAAGAAAASFAAPYDDCDCCSACKCDVDK